MSTRSFVRSFFGVDAQRVYARIRWCTNNTNIAAGKTPVSNHTGSRIHLWYADVLFSLTHLRGLFAVRTACICSNYITCDIASENMSLFNSNISRNGYWRQELLVDSIFYFFTDPLKCLVDVYTNTSIFMPIDRFVLLFFFASNHNKYVSHVLVHLGSNDSNNPFLQTSIRIDSSSLKMLNRLTAAVKPFSISY